MKYNKHETGCWLSDFVIILITREAAAHVAND